MFATRHAYSGSLTIGEVDAIARKCEVTVAFPYHRDLLIVGSPVGKVKKCLAVLGLGMGGPVTGRIQAIHDADGRCWGHITYAEGYATASARLWYLGGSK